MKYALKKKIIQVLFIINSLLLLSYVFSLSFSQDIIGISSGQEAGAIGIRGGVDGPTAIFITSSVNWYPVIIIVFELVFVSYLLFNRAKNN